MSKSWRKQGGIKDSSSYAKRLASRKVRRRPDLPNGNAYRKVLCSWTICDWNCTHSLSYEKHLLHHPEQTFYEYAYPDGGRWKQNYKEVYIPPAVRVLTSEGRRWRLRAGFVLPAGWILDPIACEYVQQGRSWPSRHDARFGFYVHVPDGKPVWVEVEEDPSWVACDKKWAERSTRNYRYSQKFPRYGRRDRKRARNMKRGSTSMP
jgi:hypothetical protein